MVAETEEFRILGPEDRALKTRSKKLDRQTIDEALDKPQVINTPMAAEVSSEQ